MAQKTINLSAGEVLEVIYTDDDPLLVYGVKVKIIDEQIGHDADSPTTVTAVPLNLNTIKIPLVGEVVLIIYAPAATMQGLSQTSIAYYLDIVSLQNSIHNNALPTAAKIELVTGPASNNSANYNEAAAGNTNTPPPAPAVDANFSENGTVKSLQPYIGDVIISGRYGNSIRLSATPKSGNFKVPPNFSNAIGKPITIYRNTKQSTDTQKINDFVTENFNTEENVIVQASGQELVFAQASQSLTAINRYTLNSWQTENWGTTPQTLISSGRIIFNSTQKEIIAFAKNGIGLSSETTIAIDAKETVSLNAEKIELGTDSTEAMILGNAFKTWMEDLIQALSTITPISPVGPCVPLSDTPQWFNIESLSAQIEPLLLSEVAFTKKTAAGTDGAGEFEVLADPEYTMSEAENQEAEAIKNAAMQIIENDNTLTPAEKAAYIDLYNTATQELSNEEKTSRAVNLIDSAKSAEGIIKKFKK